MKKAKNIIETTIGIGVGIMIGTAILIWGIKPMFPEQQHIESAQLLDGKEENVEDASALKPPIDFAVIRFVPYLPSREVLLEILSIEGDFLLVIDQKGIIYKGERVKDAGEAYQAIVDAMEIVIIERAEVR